MIAGTALLLFLVAQPAAAAETYPVAVETDAGRQTFEVEVADDSEARAQGLMWREALGPDEGMLFDFFNEALRGFWMRNTLISLDMIFIDAGGTVRRIAPEAVPRSETVIFSREAVRYVLEIPGGRAAEVDLEVGDRFDFSGLPEINRPETARPD